jgi:hypothetical protein
LSDEGRGNELPANLRPVVDFFGLPGTAVVAKDFHVVKAIAALAAIDARRATSKNARAQRPIAAAA